MSEPIVQKQPAVQSNPFAKEVAQHVNAGAVAIESERAIAEAQGKLVIAKRFPRNQALAYANIIDACRRPGLAEEACYSFPRGGEVVSGPAIRLAEMLAANWGNVDYGLRELSRKDGVSEMEAYCWDLESNVMSSQKFTVRHIRDKRGGNVALTDERDIYELTANMGARRLRARILAILPADLVAAAVDQCGKTLATGGDVPIQDRIRKMVVAFKSLGVPAMLIEKRLGHPLDATTGEELADLMKIHNSLRDNMSALTDWFGDGPKNDEQMPGDPAPEKRPAPPPRAKRGVQAIIEDPKAAPAAAPEPVTEIAATPVAEATKPEAAPEPSKETTPADPKPTPRAFLKENEVFVADCEVTDMKGVMISAGNGSTPSVKAMVRGDFNGEVTHLAGGIVTTPAVPASEGVAAVPAVVTPAKPWAVGAKLRFELFGRKISNGTIKVVVQKIEEVEDFG
jgi:hypothetical protein